MIFVQSNHSVITPVTDRAIRLLFFSRALTAAGPGVAGTQPGVPGEGLGRKDRGRVLPVHGGRRGAVRRRPAEGGQGAAGVAGLRDWPGQDLAAAGGAQGRGEAVQPDADRGPAAELPQHPVAGVPEHAPAPVVHPAGRHNHRQLAQVPDGAGGHPEHNAQKVRLG